MEIVEIIAVVVIVAGFAFWMGRRGKNMQDNTLSGGNFDNKAIRPKSEKELREGK